MLIALLLLVVAKSTAFFMFLRTILALEERVSAKSLKKVIEFTFYNDLFAWSSAMVRIKVVLATISLRELVSF